MERRARRIKGYEAHEIIGKHFSTFYPKIFAEEQEGKCKLHVKDRGIGIPEQVQRSIFELFNRGVAAGRFSGTGVGLAIVKKAVERVGGEIRIESAEGQGSEFIVTLPCELPALAKA